MQAFHCGGVSCGADAVGSWASAVSVVLARGLRSCGTGSQLPSGMWDLSKSVIEPVSPALQGEFLTTRHQ